MAKITQLPKATAVTDSDIAVIVQDGETRQIPRTLLAPPPPDDIAIDGNTLHLTKDGAPIGTGAELPEPPATAKYTATCIDMEQLGNAKFEYGGKSLNVVESYAEYSGSTAKAHILLTKTAVVSIDGADTPVPVLSGLPEIAENTLNFRTCDRIRVFFDVQFDTEEPAITISLDDFMKTMEYNFSAKSSSTISMNDMTFAVYFDIGMQFEMDTQAEAKEFADAFSSEFMQAFKKIWIYTDSAEYQVHESEVLTNAE